MGGHYFAYIKHPTEERYFVFNDSRVEEIEPDELQDMFDESCKNPKRDSPLSGAYMLLYRRVGCEVPSCSKDLIPDEIMKEIREENEKWEERAAEQKKRDLELEIRVHFKEEKMEVKMLKTDVTNDALKKAREAMKVDAELDGGLFRLRFYQGNEPRTPLTDQNKSLTDWNVRTNSTQLYLEQRDAESEFPAYKPTMKTIHLKFVNPDSGRFCFKEERDVDVMKRGTIGDLRKLCADIFKVEEKTLKLWRKRPGQNLPDALDDDSNPVHLEVNREVFVEICEDYTVKHGTYKTRTHFQELSYQSEIKYINFEGKMLSLKFDNRKTLGELRAHLAEILGRDPYSFCLEREPLSTYYSAWTDLSNKDDETLRYLEFASRVRQPKLRLIDKPGLRPGQMKIKIKFTNSEGEWITYKPDSEDNLVVVNGKMSYEESRKFFADLEPFGEPLDPKRLRIRKIWPASGDAVGALDEAMKLADLKVYDNMWLGIQVLKEPEVLKKSDRVVMICRWYPKKKK
eukprot:TRINITY_DN809_c0_g1_i3.p1 TRINITY_DN809_c0_g1~~TRINITY_DN809_c0_g1_i3.p1  ORF type:complete len:513 (-),score=106.74 TRINITY_DN809_c0_g1_i3:44-1582(-)